MDNFLPPMFTLEASPKRWKRQPSRFIILIRIIPTAISDIPMPALKSGGPAHLRLSLNLPDGAQTITTISINDIPPSLKISFPNDHILGKQLTPRETILFS
jgi:hypothetical protein